MEYEDCKMVWWGAIFQNNVYALKTRQSFLSKVWDMLDTVKYNFPGKREAGFFGDDL